MLAPVDRDAHVRAARRRQALDALAFEQDREAVLVEQLEDVLAEIEGARLDTDLFAQMTADEAQLVRTALGEDTAYEPEEEEEPDSDADDAGTDEAAEDAEDPEDEVEAEVVRLQSEIERSRGVQAALERYLELVAQQPVGEAGAR
jgi:chromosome segregation ATPase